MRHVIAAGLLLASTVASSGVFAEMTAPVRAKFVSQCEKQMYYSAPVCSCMADIADKTLDDLAIAYLSLDALDVVHSAGFSKQMTAKELASVDKFMKTAPHTCAKAT